MPFGKSFEAQLEGMIWKLAFDRHSQQPVIAIEVRHRDSQQAAWAAVDLAVNQLLWHHPVLSGLALDEWLGMLGLFNGTLLLHRYGTDSPQPRSLLALDARTGNQRYELPGLIFIDTDGQRLIAARPANEGTTPPIGFDLATGESPDPPGIQPPVPPVTLDFPHHYGDANPYFPVVARFVHRLTGQVAVKAADYLEMGPAGSPAESPVGGPAENNNKGRNHPSPAYVLVSYYIYHQDLLENRLLVVQGLNTVVLHETLSTGQGLNPEPFVMYTHGGAPSRLVFVQNSNRLLVYEC